MREYDLAIIGSGPGGYVAALYASRLKLSVCVIEKDLVGGTCLNRGCIPTKALLHSASIIASLNDARLYGIDVDSYRFSFAKAQARKDDAVIRLRTGIDTLFRVSSIEFIKGVGRISGKDRVIIDGSKEIKAKNIIIATGSVAAEVPNIEIDERDILSSDGALNLKEVPKGIVIVGGGVIGCEFAGIFNAFGTKVTIVEMLERLIFAQSREASKKLELIYKKKGIEIFTSSKVESVDRDGVLRVKISEGREISAEKLLVAVGRKPNTSGLGLEEAHVKTEKGRVVVDEYLRTNFGNIYAIGDCVSGPLLAHKASYDGMLACDNILGMKRRVDYSNIPNCIWTDPQVSSVGLCEEEAKAKYPDAKVAKYPYLASGKAFIMGKSEGFIKIIGDSKGVILGVEILGAEACDLIGEAVLAKSQGVNIKDWARVVHGHPTLSEIFQEAAHVFCGTGIHSI